MTLEELREGKIFIIDKPLDWTSFDVVNKIRWNIRKTFGLKKFKVGHAGTLDPKATGVLVICVGKFTKRIQTFQNESKAYTGTFKLGATTVSYDTEKEETEFFETSHITEEKIEKITEQFKGKLMQYPPIHSAIKVKGRKLYEMARKGEEVKPEPREVFIEKFKITKIDLPFVDFEVKCSKGTYIRSLANDFGKALNSGAYLFGLRRIASGDFEIEQADNSPLDIEFFQSE